MPTDVRIIVESYLMCEIYTIVSNNPTDENREMVRRAGKCIISAKGTISLDEALFIGSLGINYDIKAMTLAASRGYYGTTTYLYNTLRNIVKGKLLLQEAAVVSDNISNLECALEGTEEVDLLWLLEKAAGGKGDKIFRWIYFRLLDPLSSDFADKLFDKSICLNSDVARFLLYETKLPLNVDTSIFKRIEFVTDVKLIRDLAISMDLSTDITARILRKVAACGSPDVYIVLSEIAPPSRDQLLEHIKAASFRNKEDRRLLKYLVERAPPDGIPNIECAARVSDEQLRRFLKYHLKMTPMAMAIVVWRGGDYKSFFSDLDREELMETFIWSKQVCSESLGFTNAVADYLDHKTIAKGFHNIIGYCRNRAYIKIFLEKGYQPSSSDIRLAVEVAAIETLKLLLESAPHIDLSDIHYWTGITESYEVSVFIKSGIIPPQEVLMRAVVGSITESIANEEDVLSDTVKEIIPYIEDKGSVLDNIDELTDTLIDELYRLGITAD